MVLSQPRALEVTWTVLVSAVKVVPYHTKRSQALAEVSPVEVALTVRLRMWMLSQMPASSRCTSECWPGVL